MQPIENSQTDSTAGIVPTPRLTAPWRVATVTPFEGQKLHVAFLDGTAGEVRMDGFLGSSAVDCTIFEALRDPEFFRQARVELGAVAWPNGADLAPDAMYDAICTSGSWVVRP